ncbi:solute:sodium symporter family transporter [Levilactobacillus lindianensis]|uniref:solute:sodium symporter family transporter n=1 Tax=Levilactobacillus lindianensis TaxID=2486018 RepID=UPI000F74379F|nr:solute:sodium symporter family transporter [Levilactobacillus lindianensis]
MGFWTLGSFILFTLLVALISWLKTRSNDLTSSTGYFLGGRSLSGIFIAGSLLLTNLSAEQLVGLNGNGFSSGLSSMAWEITSGVTLVLMTLVFLPKYLKGGFTTVPEFLEKRYDKGTRNIVTALFLTSLTVVTLPTVLYAGGLAITSLFDLTDIFHITELQSLTLVIVLIGVLGSSYAIIGGLKAVAVSDTINGVGLLAGGFLIPILGFFKLGGGHFWDGVNKLIVEHPEKMNAVTNTGATPFLSIFTGVLLVNTFYWCTNQEIVQRAFAAKDLREGQKGVLYAGFIKVFVPIILVIPGIIAFHLYGSKIPSQDMAYAYLVRDILPGPLLGFFGAVLFGAVLSAFNGALNSASTMFCINIYKPIFKPDIDDKKLVKIGRIFGIFIVIFAIFVAPNIAKAPEGLYIFMKSVMGYFNIPTLVVVLMGFFTKRTPAIGAKLAILFFLVSYTLYKFVFKFDINYLHVYGILFLCCIAIMLIAGWIHPRPTPYELHDVKLVDLTPWKLARPLSAVIITVVVYVYTVFSPIGIVFHKHYGMRLAVITLIFAAIATTLFLVINKYFNHVQVPESEENENEEEQTGHLDHDGYNA